MKVLMIGMFPGTVEAMQAEDGDLVIENIPPERTTISEVQCKHNRYDAVVLNSVMMPPAMATAVRDMYPSTPIIAVGPAGTVREDVVAAAVCERAVSHPRLGIALALVAPRT